MIDENPADKNKTSKVYHPKDIHTPNDAKAYGKNLKTRKVFSVFHNRYQIQVAEGRDEEVRSPQNISHAKNYILSHYKRTFGNKVENQIGQEEPDYIRDFKFTEEVDVLAKYRAWKKYGYDFKQEDAQL